jgi:hypothetical protein
MVSSAENNKLIATLSVLLVKVIPIKHESTIAGFSPHLLKQGEAPN